MCFCAYGFRSIHIVFVNLAGFCESWILVFGYTNCGRGWALIQAALWISEQCYGICQLAGCFVSLCVVDIGVVEVFIRG